MAADDIPEISPDRAAAQYLAGQEAALQSREPAETRTQLGSARTSGNTDATTR
ncbi:hypothetical protein AB0L80_07520 [Streptomyces sp. NPDC052069]|uniref:hypothetical protein n=1 Tax=Streptomyces sp. NPDC052069 TaxID=3154650 RepID=UPI00343A519E